MKRVFGNGLMLLTLAAGVPLCLPAWGSYPAAPVPAPGGHASQAQGYFGVDLRDVSDDQVTALKLRDKNGAEIILVDHDAPAGKAGLREHDVLLRINGQAIATQDQARRILHDIAPASSVVLFVSRDGQLLTVTARMSTRDEVERQAWAQHLAAAGQPDASESAASAGAVPASAATAPTIHAGNSFIGSILMNSTYTGAMLEQMSKQLADFFGVPAGAGLLVRSVVDNSPAAAAGLHAGDVILRVNNKPVASTGDWSKAIKNSHGRALAVAVLRDKKEQTLTLTPDGKHRSSLEELIQAPERTIVAHLGHTWMPHS